MTRHQRWVPHEDEHSGAGRHLENGGAQQSYSLGSYTITVFQAEVFTILMVAHREDVKSCRGEILICSDSQADLRAIRQKEVELVCVQGHMEIPENSKGL
ncbi:hypothetical protein NQ315_006607 [Exocentrus adspersus]|uniref:Uncharacterized protein n=1 Tax=Exocentrus adspersus TaxID=1586481 RepID=A0AAV8VEN7_9CUCU|nr:hypothetical protein NQ315_006607 [Exocentrus adspersus]